MNVHHKKWLRFSNADTPVGCDLKGFCDYHGLSQLVREPTRNEYLLDLAISDVPKASASVLHAVADHRATLVRVPLPAAVEAQSTRIVWSLDKADWANLERGMAGFDWSIVRQGTAEDALNHFLEVLWLHIVKFISQREIKNHKGTHPWLDDKCRNAVAAKNAAEGTDEYEIARLSCIKVLHWNNQIQIANAATPN